MTKSIKMTICCKNLLDLVFQVLRGMIYAIWGKKSKNGIKYEKKYNEIKTLECKKIIVIS